MIHLIKYRRFWGVFAICAAVLLVRVLNSPPALADMGRIHATDVRVKEESQKAIILHNLNEEILILGTDLKAESDMGMIRFIPFPSEPKVELAAGDPFKAVMDLVGRHKLAFLFKTKGGAPSASGVEVRFSKKLGAHDVTILKIHDTKAVRQWANDFFSQKGLPVKNSYPEIEAVAEDYVRRGIDWFVFDYVKLDKETRSVDPLVYRFQTKELYYPLVTSNTFGGEGEIILFLISPRSACEPLNLGFSNCLGLENLMVSTSGEISMKEAESVFGGANSFFAKGPKYLQCFRYYGPYRFDRDIIFDLEKEGFEKPFPTESYSDDRPNPFKQLIKE